MTKIICKYCANFDADYKINYCMCSPYPYPTDYYCRKVDFDGCNSPDLVDCPDCVFALQGKLCVRGHVGGGQSDCPYYQSCLI
jgi:hypothetical protein